MHSIMRQWQDGSRPPKGLWRKKFSSTNVFYGLLISCCCRLMSHPMLKGKFHFVSPTYLKKTLMIVPWPPVFSKVQITDLENELVSCETYSSSSDYRIEVLFMESDFGYSQPLCYGELRHTEWIMMRSKTLVPRDFSSQMALWVYITHLQKQRVVLKLP